MRSRIVFLNVVTSIWLALSAAASAQSAPIILTDQGPAWTPELRADFYGHDQGSKMIPLGWLRSLNQANGQAFLADGLARYGYLPRDGALDNLPVGFTVTGLTGSEVVGMTCSACHTRQIVAAGKTYRIDGGPAIADFQSLLKDLDDAVGKVATSDAAFVPFAASVLGSPTPDPEDIATLRNDVQAWYLRFHTLITRALPAHPWGPARLDAISMIFNRLTGMDLGAPPSLLIAQNIASADAPVRYPFLWNAPRQDETQWSGFADNGSDVLALSRNLGEVFGVFGVFQPRKEGPVVNFLSNNSASFEGLAKNEQLIKQIGPPKWPWSIDADLAARGKLIFERTNEQGGCIGCHGVQAGKTRFLLQDTWKTPVQNVATDTRQFDVLTRTAATGALEGAYIPLLTQPLGQTDLAINVLKVSVIGSIAEHVLNIGGASEAIDFAAAAPNAFRPALLSQRLPLALRDLQGAFNGPGQGVIVPDALGAHFAAPSPMKGAYESRVLEGIWAVAPYLHNGSVPTLAELLKPAAERVAKFKIGPAYDIENIGLAADQTQFDFELETTDCSDLNSGNSRCGHEFGTQLTAPEKKALLEYLKTL